MRNKIIDTFNHVVGRHGFDYDAISDSVFIGSNMCCQFGFNKELLSKGVRADISLEEDRVDTPTGVDYYLWLPTMNEHASSPDQIRLGVAALTLFARRNIRVFIHCRLGHGRAPTLYIAYLIHTGMTVSSALAMLQRKRPTVHLTDDQMQALKQFEAGARMM